MTLEDQMLLEEYQRDRKRFNEDAQKAVIAANHSIHTLVSGEQKAPKFISVAE